MSTSQACIGVDFGTSKCSIGTPNSRCQPTIILNSLDNRCTPVYLGFNEDDGFAYGEFVKMYHDTSSDGLAFGLRRLIAQLAPNEFSSYDKEALRELNDIKNSEMRNVNVLTTKLLERLRVQANEYLKCEVTSAVMSVPYAFSRQTCDRLRRAALNAGFVHVHLVAETHAAALGYLDDNGICRSVGEVATNLLVFSYGGGFMEATFLQSASKEDLLCSGEASSGNFAVTLASAVGGGEEMTQRIMDRLDKMCMETTGCSLLKKHRLRIEARGVAENLKAGTTSSFKFSSVEIEKDFDGKFTENDFKLACEDLLGHVEEWIEEIHRKLSEYNVEVIALVGGSTRLPVIRDLLTKYFPGARLSKAINAEEAVVLGATILANESLSDAKTDGAGRLQIMSITIPEPRGPEIPEQPSADMPFIPNKDSKPPTPDIPNHRPVRRLLKRVCIPLVIVIVSVTLVILLGCLFGLSTNKPVQTETVPTEELE